MAGSSQPQSVFELFEAEEELGQEYADLSNGTDPIGGQPASRDVVDGDRSFDVGVANPDHTARAEVESTSADADRTNLSMSHRHAFREKPCVL